MARSTTGRRSARSRPTLLDRAPARPRAWLLAALVALATGLPAQAQPSGLADALEIMSVYRSIHPQAGAAYDELLARVPPEVRAQVQASDWAASQARMTAAELEDAATDNEIRFVQTPDGLAAIPSRKIANAINGLTDFAIEQNEMAEVLAKVRERFPAVGEGVVGQILGALETATSSPRARFLSAPAAKLLISRFAASQIDAESEKLRDQILSDSAAALSDARRRGMDLKAKVAVLADQAAGARAAPVAPPAPVTDSPPAAAPPAPADDPALVARLDQAFSVLDASRAGFDQQIAEDERQCQRTAEAMKPDNPGGIQGRARALKSEIDRATSGMRPDLVGDQVAYTEFSSLIETLERIVGQAESGADRACAIARAADPDLDAVRERVLKTRSLGVIANRIADSARDRAARLLDRFGSIEDIRGQMRTAYRHDDALERLRNFCTGVALPLPAVEPRLGAMHGPSVTILDGLREAGGGKLTPALTAAYATRYDDHFARLFAITHRVDRKACNAQREAAGRMCSRSGPMRELYGEIELSLDVLKGLLEERARQRATQADRVRSEAQRIDAIVSRLAGAEATAGRCLDDADRKPRSGGAVALVSPPPPPPPGPGGTSPMVVPGPLPGPVPPVGPTTGPPLVPPPAPVPPPGPTAVPPPAPTTGPAPARPPGTATTAPDCVPAKVAKPKPDITPGFVPVPYKGATAWTGATNPDCPPYGPAAKGVDDGLTTTDAKPAVVPQACKEADAALARGRQHYLAGRVTEYRVALTNAERDLGRLKDSRACADQRAKVAEGAGQADLLENVIKSADQALAACEEGGLRKLSGLLSKTNHPHVASLRKRIDRMAAVAGDIDRADAARAAGRSVDAARLYRQAAAGLDAEPDRCPNLARRVRDGEQRIKVTALDYTPETSPHTKATGDCKSRFGTHALAVPNPDSLTGYTCDCADPLRMEGGACVPEKSAHERAAEAHATCRSSFGESAYAQAKDSTYQDYGCLCGKGHAWNETQTKCVPQSQEQMIADANHRCQVANKSKRARAGKYLGNDQWSCVIDRSRAEVIADANRACQRANRNDRRVRAGRLLPNGQWSCYIPGARRVVTRHQQQPNYDAAAAAAAAAVVIQGIGSLMRHQSSRPPVYRGSGHHHLR